MDTEYLNFSDFYLDDNNIRLRVDYESKNKCLVLFVDKDKIKWIKKFKELLGYRGEWTKDEYHLAIIYITPEFQTMIDDSDDFIIPGDIIFYYEGKYKDKIKLLFENNLQKSVDRLDKNLFSSIGSTDGTNTKEEDNSNKYTTN